MEIRRYVIEIDKSTGMERTIDLDKTISEEKKKLMKAVVEQGMSRAGFIRQLNKD